MILWICLVASHVTLAFGKLIQHGISKHVFMLFSVCHPIINVVPLPVGLAVRLLQNIKLGRLDLGSHTHILR